MNATMLTDGFRLNAVANTTLKMAARFWFVVAVFGQLAFAFYVAAFYGGSVAHGDWLAWNKVLPHGYVEGHTMGNIAIAVHLLLAFIITVGGPLQLIPQVRAHYPVFHRWNGRVYLLTALIMSTTGLYLVLSGRTQVGDTSQHIAVCINAILIMLCAGMALRYALARDFKTHRRWALRLFLVVSGVWFFRVGLMLSFVIFQRPFGFDPKTFAGPFLTLLGFAQYLLPLAVLEIYLRTQDRAGAPGRLAMATGLLVLTIAMGIGIFAAIMGMWLPRI